MAAVIKRKRRSQRKNPRKQTRGRKIQAKQGRKAKSTHVKKNSRKKSSYKHKELPLTKKARGILGSCVEGLCKAISSEADRLRKEKCEPKISRQVLLAALEQSMSKRKIRHSVTPGIKKVKKKKQSSADVAKKVSSLTEPNQKLPKQRKQSTSPITE